MFITHNKELNLNTHHQTIRDYVFNICNDWFVIDVKSLKTNAESSGNPNCICHF